MTGLAIEIDTLSKAYGRQSVLNDISLRVGGGESLALVGLNGAGKTTLIRCLMDFQRADRGRLAIDGRPSTLASARARVAYLPERFLPPAFLTGLEFLALSCDLHGLRWNPALARDCCARLALDWPLLEKPVRNLSKGNGQKLGLAACLLSQKRVYILDEPFSGLDVQARALAMRALLDLRETGCTLLFSCHEPADIDVLCHRLALLHRGRLQFCDTPAALRLRHGEPGLEAAVLACLADPG